jgi:hypothetical protein
MQLIGVRDKDLPQNETHNCEVLDLILNRDIEFSNVLEFISNFLDESFFFTIKKINVINA